MSAMQKERRMRVHNFFPGPAALPLEVIKQVQSEMDDFAGMGMSILELSHRTDQYDQVHNEASALLRKLFGIPKSYHVMWLQGGASMQFAMLPMNLLRDGQSADYIETGVWSERAITEAQIIGKARIAGSSKSDGYVRLPKLDFDPDAQYVHLTSNNTIMGTQFAEYPDTGSVPLVADMSSDILSRRVDISKLGMVYAGAHKNLGPSGITVAIMSDEMLQRCREDLPTLLKYSTHDENNSMFNTPVTFTIYVVKLVLDWIEKSGGLEAIEKINEEKAKLFYDFVDNSGGFYTCGIDKVDRSKMNAIFNLPSVDLEEKFSSEAWTEGMVGLKNLPQRGGCRVSMYNAVSVESVKELLSFMKRFMEVNG
jgi:phosphoserine aminotransferase